MTAQSRSRRARGAVVRSPASGCQFVGIALRRVSLLAALVAAFALVAATPALASSVTSASLSLSSTSATATQVTYGAKFTATTSLTNVSTVTLTAPGGTVLPADPCDYTITDPRTRQAKTCPTAALAPGASDVTLTSGIAIAAGDPVVVTINAVGNGAAAGARSMGLFTSADSTSVPVPFTITAPTTVTLGSVSVSSKAATATQVTYTAKFTATNGLTRNFSTVTLYASAGTQFPTTGCNYSISDPRTHQSQDCVTATVSAGLNSVTLTTGVAMSGGDPVVVTANGVANSATAGTKYVGIWTTSDPHQFLTSWASTAPTSVTGASLSLSSNAATATQVSYVAKFKATSSLTRNFSTITLTAAPGTVLPTSNCAYTIADARLNQSVQCLPDTVSGGQNAVTIVTALTIGPGDGVTVTVTNVGNSSTAGVKSLAVSTSSDPVALTSAYTLTGSTAVSAPSLSLSSNSAAATEVTYVAKFRATNGLTRNISTVTLTAVAGTAFPSDGCAYTIADPRLNRAQRCLTTTLGSGSHSVTITTGITIGAGDAVVVTVDGVTNLPTAGASNLSVSTTSDPIPASTPFTLSAATRETAASVALSSYAATASEVTYTVNYVATSGLTPGYSRVSLTGPAGTAWSSGGCGVYVITDNTTGDSQSCLTATVSAGSNGVALVSGVNVSAGDVVTVTANGATNLSTPGNISIALATTSDPVAVPLAVTLVPATHETAVAASLTSYSATASQVTYSVNYVATGGLTQNFSRVTMTAPTGTAFVNGGGCGVYVITDNTTGDTQNCLTAAVSAGSNGVTIVSGINASAGDVVTVSANGVTTTTTTGPSTIFISTTSDPVVAPASFTLTAPTRESAVTLSLSSYSATASQVSYGVSYVATSGLTANFSRVTLNAPAGTAFANGGGCGTYVITDDTTGDSQNCPAATVAAGSNGVTLASGINVAPGDVVTITANGVTNTDTSGGKSVSVTTTSDPINAAVSFTLTAPARETGVSLSVSSHSASHAPTTYAVQYTATNGLTQGFSTVTLAAPAGTVFAPEVCDVYVITDNTTGDSQNCVAATVTPGSNSVTLVSPITVSARDVVTVTVNGVTNPPGAGGKNLAFSTSSDPVAVSLPYTLTAALTAPGHAGVLL